MKLTYRVHRVSQHEYPTPLNLADGSQIIAKVPVYIVEMLPLDQHAEAGALKLALDKAPNFGEGATIEFNVQESV